MTFLTETEIKLLLTDFKQELLTYLTQVTCEIDSRIREHIENQLKTQYNVSLYSGMLHSYIEFLSNGNFSFIHEYGGPECYEASIIFSYKEKTIRFKCEYLSHTGFTFDNVSFEYVIPHTISETTFI